ncbi:hypothetical protein MWU59_10420 [Flavobacteriaceae bacterium F08102]|nr:hypothetical protein [Flavobacteriaceae bacterium F08102]
MKLYLSIIITLGLGLSTIAQTVLKPSTKSDTYFAIVVDNTTFEGAKGEILAYRNSVEKDGLGTYIIHHNWSNPSEIRKILKDLYSKKKRPLEGAVFIGNIPIPMVREAQNLTSAFKMPERISWYRSSVPSDRYYDDFDLQFEFIKQDEDEKRKDHFYFKLKPESPQYIEMDIYTGRIKPPVSSNQDNPIEMIKSYLTKLVEVRKEDNQLNEMIVSTGHGYNSNSMNSWAGENMALRTSFPDLFKQGNSIKFLSYRNAEFIKFNLLTKLQRETLDFAFMTGHGTSSLQLLNGYPNVSNPNQSMVNVSRYIRSKMRNGKDSGSDLEALKAKFQSSLGLNDKWFLDAFSKEKIEEDSIYNVKMDINKNDLKNINARVAYINSCLTGSFQLKDYLAGHYPFSDGKNVVAFANSVGVLQDLWSLEYLGIIQHGARVGHLLKKTAFLETHILGDPTFHFQSNDQVELNRLMGAKISTKFDWEDILKRYANNADIKAYALNELYNLEDESTFSPRLLDIFKTSPFEAVRTKCYFLLRRYGNQDFYKALALAKDDNYEYLRRKAAYDYAEMGDDKYIDDIIDFYIENIESKRVIYKLKSALQFFNYDKVLASLDKKLKNNSTINNSEELYESLTKSILNNEKRMKSLRAEFSDPNISDKALTAALRTMRAYRHHLLVPNVIKIIENQNKSDEIRITALETLSWYGFSYTRQEIIDLCNSLIGNNKVSTALKDQALKTLNLIKDSGRRPF